MDESKREESLVFYGEGLLDVHTERPVTGRVITREKMLRVHKYLEEKYKEWLSDV